MSGSLLLGPDRLESPGSQAALSDAPTARGLAGPLRDGVSEESAVLLGISPETVRWHLGRLFERCGCSDEAQAAYRHHAEIAQTGHSAPAEHLVGLIGDGLT